MWFPVIASVLGSALSVRSGDAERSRGHNVEIVASNFTNSVVRACHGVVGVANIHCAVDKLSLSRLIFSGSFEGVGKLTNCLIPTRLLADVRNCVFETRGISGVVLESAGIECSVDHNFTGSQSRKVLSSGAYCFTDCIFRDMTSLSGDARDGAAIRGSYGTCTALSLMNCQFENIGPVSSTVYVLFADGSEDPLSMSGCTFKRITVGDGRCDGGAGLNFGQLSHFKMSFCIFDVIRATGQSTGNSNGNGGVLSMNILVAYGGTATLEYCQFTDVENIGDGALFYSSDTVFNLIMDHCIADNIRCTGSEKGGGITLSKSGKPYDVRITNSTFSRMSNMKGCILYTPTSSSIGNCLLKNCTIDSCNGNGGGDEFGLICANIGVFQCSGTQFLNIKFGRDICQIYIYGSFSESHADLSWCTFDNYTSKHLFGFPDGRQFKSLNLSFCHFSDYEVVGGGNLICTKLTPVTRVSNCVFSSVSAHWALLSMADAGSLSELSVLDSSFINCISTEGGIIRCQVGNGFAIEGCTFESCSSQHSAGMVIDCGISGVVRGCTFRSMSVSNGVVCHFSHSQNEPVDCTFEDLSSDSSCGGLSLEFGSASDSFCFNSCKFIDIRSSGKSGAVCIPSFVSSSGKLTFRSCSFERVISSSGGSVIMSESGVYNLNLDMCSFCDLRSNAFGSFGDCSLTSLSITNCNFEDIISDNSVVSASFSGQSNDPVSLCGCIFRNVTSSVCGGCGLNFGSLSQFCLSFCIFEDISNSGNGGVLNLDNIVGDGGNAVIEYCHFSGVVCSGSGSLFYSSSTCLSLSVSHCIANDIKCTGRGQGGSISLCKASSVGSSGYCVCLENSTFSQISNMKGCILYTPSESLISNCLLKNCTIDSCNGKGDADECGLICANIGVFQCHGTEFVDINYRMISQIYIYGSCSASDAEVCWCTFDNYRTKYLFGFASGRRFDRLDLLFCNFNEYHGHTTERSNIVSTGSIRKVNVDSCEFASVSCYECVFSMDQGAPQSELNISNSVFRDCRSVYRGILCCYSGDGFRIEQCVFESCTSSGSEGMIIESSVVADREIVIDSCKFMNICGIKGLPIMGCNSVSYILAIHNCLFSGIHNTIINAMRGEGSGCRSLTLSGCSFESISDVTDVICMSFVDDAHFDMFECSFVDVEVSGEAMSGGSGLSFYRLKRFCMISCTFEGLSCGCNGGVLNLDNIVGDGGNAVIEYCHFSGVVCSGSGSLFYSSSTCLSLSVSHCIANDIKCTGRGQGGSISLCKASSVGSSGYCVCLENSTFSQISNMKGCILYTPSESLISNCLLKNCSIDSCDGGNDDVGYGLICANIGVFQCHGTEFLNINYRMISQIYIYGSCSASHAEVCWCTFDNYRTKYLFDFASGRQFDRLDLLFCNFNEYHGPTTESGNIVSLECIPSVVISMCEFTSVSCYGALFNMNQADSTLSISDSIFTSCATNTEALVVSSMGRSCTIAGCSFDSCTSGYLIMLSGSGVDPFTLMSNCHFTRINSCIIGITGGISSECSIVSSIFESCSQTSGKLLDITAESSGSVSFTECEFDAVGNSGSELITVASISSIAFTSCLFKSSCYISLHERDNANIGKFIVADSYVINGNTDSMGFLEFSGVKSFEMKNTYVEGGENGCPWWVSMSLTGDSTGDRDVTLEDLVFSNVHANNPLISVQRSKGVSLNNCSFTGLAVKNIIDQSDEGSTSFSLLECQVTDCTTTETVFNLVSATTITMNSCVFKVTQSTAQTGTIMRAKSSTAVQLSNCEVRGIILANEKSIIDVEHLNAANTVSISECAFGVTGTSSNLIKVSGTGASLSIDKCRVEECSLTTGNVVFVQGTLNSLSVTNTLFKGIGESSTAVKIDATTGSVSELVCETNTFELTGTALNTASCPSVVVNECKFTQNARSAELSAGTLGFTSCEFTNCQSVVSGTPSKFTINGGFVKATTGYSAIPLSCEQASIESCTFENVKFSLAGNMLLSIYCASFTGPEVFTITNMNAKFDFIGSVHFSGTLEDSFKYPDGYILPSRIEYAVEFNSKSFDIETCHIITDMPTESPSETESDSMSPSESESDTPSFAPSESESDTPSFVPSESESDTPSFVPSESESDTPSFVPSESESDTPSESESTTTTGSSKPASSEPESNTPTHSPSDEPAPVVTSNSDDQTTGGNDPNTGLIIGIVGGVVAAIVIAVVILFLLFRRNTKEKQSSGNDETGNTYELGATSITETMTTDMSVFTPTQVLGTQNGISFETHGVDWNTFGNNMMSDFEELHNEAWN